MNMNTVDMFIYVAHIRLYIQIVNLHDAGIHNNEAWNNLRARWLYDDGIYKSKTPFKCAKRKLRKKSAHNMCIYVQYTCKIQI